mmetsp:Transcript_12524/g.18715  ORF Transcript_12524/g.18715 Transcript_12524/m.18715 type:complete len:306 (-) Transcript_12524:312-1229(-)|eukprot:CAMPEP_0167742456 /NCGR_PEP_ID=MMETSP0110_2-20121227/1441_1 /TAXON_ID=629695 /ORGANISM="Gymnochlora sp., Strain CCMP2014" /LENGTH=305 /DNA_ID=CAMNT_0007626659 /DNA_START=25 /DNA_END=942 /DNA_ORIENTATION=+
MKINVIKHLIGLVVFALLLAEPCGAAGTADIPPQVLSKSFVEKARKTSTVFDKMGFSAVRRIAKQQASEPGHAHMFNIFRMAGDFLHLASFAFLILQFHTGKSCLGISLKSQELYLIVFASRYIDIFWNFISFYNTMMKLLFLGTTVYIIYMMRIPLRKTRTKEPNGLRNSAILIGAAFCFSLVYNDRLDESSWSSTIVEILWSFSIYLEAVAIIPQMEVLGRAKTVKNLTANYIFALGAYRVFYLINYAYRFSVDPVSSQEFIIKAIGAVVQTALYARFFMMYLESKKLSGVGADVVLNPKGIV